MLKFSPMKNFLVFLPFLFCLSIPDALGQQQTEIYIPIGQSPGVSDHHSVMGEIDSIHDRTGDTVRFTLTGDARLLIRGDQLTRIYLDNSKNGARNIPGTLGDLKVGRFIEVKFRNNDPHEGAEWIKIRQEQHRQHSKSGTGLRKVFRGSRRVKSYTPNVLVLHKMGG